MRILLIYIIFLGLISISCEKKEKLFNQINLKNADRITILKGYPEELIQVDTILPKDF